MGELPREGFEAMPQVPSVNVDLGDLVKPATVLVKKISGAVGTVFEPTRIRRRARAEADAARIAAYSLVEVSEIERRGLERFIREQGQKQQNIEDIIRVAIEHLRPDAKPEEVEGDWIAHLFERARIVSDEQMKALWGRILAGEANVPGSFSRRTIEFAPTLDKYDAELFSRLRRFCVKVDHQLTPFIYEHEPEIKGVYSRDGINFATLEHLASIGLITFDNRSVYTLHDLPIPCEVSYFEDRFLISPYNRQLRIGQCGFTKTGRELAHVCAVERSSEFWEWFVRKLSLGFSPRPVEG